MIQAKIINKIKFPEITLQDDLEHIAKNIIIPDMVMGIDNSNAITGGALPENEPATIKRKGSSRPLIEKGELRSSFYYRVSGKNKVIIRISTIRDEIGKHLQVDGIRTRHGMKYYRFFGISKDAYDGAMGYIRNKIKELTSGNKK